MLAVTLGGVVWNLIFLKALPIHVRSIMITRNHTGLQYCPKPSNNINLGVMMTIIIIHGVLFLSRS